MTEEYALNARACVCGEVITVEDPDDWEEIAAAVLGHNRSFVHREWRTRDSLGATLPDGWDAYERRPQRDFEPALAIADEPDIGPLPSLEPARARRRRRGHRRD